MPPTRSDAADEVAYLRYGSRVLTRLGEAGAPLSDPALYHDIRTDAGDSFPQFRRALDGMVGRGVLMIAGKEPEFGDPLYAFSMPPG